MSGSEQTQNKPPGLKGVLGGGLHLTWGFVRRRPWSFGLAVGGAIVFVSAIVASAIVVGRVTDSLIIPVLKDGESIEGNLLPAILLIVGVSLWKAVGITIRRAAAGWLQYGTRADARKRLIDHQLRLDLAWHDRRSTGDLLSVSEVDTNQGTFVLAPFPYATGSAMLLIGTIVLVGVTDLFLGLTMLIGLVVTVGIDIHGAFRTFEPFVAVQEERGVVSEIAHESIDGALTVKALGRGAEETERFARSANRLRDKIVYVNGMWVGYRAIVESLPSVLTVMILIVGTYRLSAGAVTAGDLVTIAYLLSLMTMPISLLGFVIWEMAHSLAAWQRVQAVLDSDSLVEHGAAVATRDGRGGAVDSSGVTFGYTDATSVLTDVNVDIFGGKVVAVVGPTGSGKSTLALLLSRLWDPSAGTITLDGRDLRDFARSELAGEVAFVAQESFLFDDTIEGNITLGVDMPRADVLEAARLAGVERFINELDYGYDTKIGERGTSLSGGQRQRVALARALVRHPRVLVLDDATSAVDPSVEIEILKGLRRSELPSTVVIVAYRRSSISLADEVVFMEDGRVVAQGTHSDLMATQPGYVRLLSAYEDDATEGDVPG
ncbi:MAG: ABC transporter ATP-binding protein/permease [Actinomycetia bacterium]|nr:ABC transporter ATP-binding protein/permease [Actinomycetes bacterium]